MPPKGEQASLLTDLLDALLVDYTTHQRRSHRNQTYRIAILKTAFARERALDITTTRIEKYKAAQLADGYANPTINRDLAALNRAFRLGIDQERITHRPKITLLPETPRQGFVEPATFARIASHLPSPLDTVAQFAYTSGWRKNEVLTLAWTDVDRTRGLITLKIEHSKTKEPRTLPIPPGPPSPASSRPAGRPAPSRNRTARRSSRLSSSIGMGSRSTGIFAGPGGRPA